jgi:hypothetical protein
VFVPVVFQRSADTALPCEPPHRAGTSRQIDLPYSIRGAPARAHVVRGHVAWSAEAPQLPAICPWSHRNSGIARRAEEVGTHRRTKLRKLVGRGVEVAPAQQSKMPPSSPLQAACPQWFGRASCQCPVRKKTTSPIKKVQTPSFINLVRGLRWWAHKDSNLGPAD